MFRFYFGHRFRFHDSSYKKKKNHLDRNILSGLLVQPNEKKMLRKNAWLSKKNSQESNKNLRQPHSLWSNGVFFSFYILNSLLFFRDFFHRTHTHTQFSLRILKFNLTSNRKKSTLLVAEYFFSFILIRLKWIIDRSSKEKYHRCSIYMTIWFTLCTSCATVGVDLWN